MILDIYKILFIISFYFIINTPKKHFNYNNKIQWQFKFAIIYIAMFTLFLCIYYDNKYITKYILPFFIFINVVWLIYAPFFMDYKHKINWTYFIPLILTVYLIFTFKFKDFYSKNGILLNPNENWFYLYVISIVLWTIFICNDCNKLHSIILTIYPLFFPFNEFLLHRGFSLYFYIVYGHYFNFL